MWDFTQVIHYWLSFSVLIYYRWFELFLNAWSKSGIYAIKEQVLRGCLPRHGTLMPLPMHFQGLLSFKLPHPQFFFPSHYFLIPCVFPCFSAIVAPISLYPPLSLQIPQSLELPSLFNIDRWTLVTRAPHTLWACLDRTQAKLPSAIMAPRHAILDA